MEATSAGPGGWEEESVVVSQEGGQMPLTTSVYNELRRG